MSYRNRSRTQRHRPAFRPANVGICLSRTSRLAPLSPAETLQRSAANRRCALERQQRNWRKYLRHREIAAARDELMQAIERQSKRTNWQKYGEKLNKCWANCMQVLAAASRRGAHALDGFQLLNWPDPQMEADAVQAIDISTIIVTHTRPQKAGLYVFFVCAARRARPVTGCTKFVAPCKAKITKTPRFPVNQPCFTRVRMGEGVRRFRIESRNPHSIAFSDVFRCRNSRALMNFLQQVLALAGHPRPLSQFWESREIGRPTFSK